MKIVACAVFIVLVFGCADGRVVFGNIPPITFQFRTVVENDDGSRGGWQVAQVVVMLGRLSTMFPRTAFCNVEVGTPITNTQQGFIPVEMAQEESARASDLAARDLFQVRQPVAKLCRLFQEKMEYYLASEEVGTIRGARVSNFKAWSGRRVPRRTFPPKRGR